MLIIQFQNCTLYKYVSKDHICTSYSGLCDPMQFFTIISQLVYWLFENLEMTDKRKIIVKVQGFLLALKESKKLK